MGSVVGDPDRGDVAFDADPLVLLCVAQILRRHRLSLPVHDLASLVPVGSSEPWTMVAYSDGSLRPAIERQDNDFRRDTLVTDSYCQYRTGLRVGGCYVCHGDGLAQCW